MINTRIIKQERGWYQSNPKVGEKSEEFIGKRSRRAFGGDRDNHFHDFGGRKPLENSRSLCLKR